MVFSLKKHKNKAFQAFCDAEDLCVWLPEDKQDIAYQLFQTAVCTGYQPTH